MFLNQGTASDHEHPKYSEQVSDRNITVRSAGNLTWCHQFGRYEKFDSSASCASALVLFLSTNKFLQASRSALMGSSGRAGRERVRNFVYWCSHIGCTSNTERVAALKTHIQDLMCCLSALTCGLRRSATCSHNSRSNRTISSSRGVVPSRNGASADSTL